MSQGNPGLDLSSLPPEIRRKVEAGLAKLTPEMRQHLQTQGSPILAKMIANAGGRPNKGPPPLPTATGTASQVMDRVTPVHAPHHLNPRSKPHGHYNDTVRPGDSSSLRWFPAAVVIALVLLFLWY